jgi:hypothetical protein
MSLLHLILVNVCNNVKRNNSVYPIEAFDLFLDPLKRCLGDIQMVGLPIPIGPRQGRERVRYQ